MGRDVTDLVWQMVDKVDKMSKDSLRALLNNDLTLASSVIDSMDYVRELYAKVFK